MYVLCTCTEASTLTVTGYENMFGLAPANYSMAGSPAGLARIDKLFGLDMYTSTFTASPLVFGAFPSLHAGNATIEALFLSYLFPRFRPAFIAYTLWIWWATMYLSHHYAVDLVGGSMREWPASVSPSRLTAQWPAWCGTLSGHVSYLFCRGARPFDGTTTTSSTATLLSRTSMA